MKLFLPAMGAAVSAQNIFHEFNYKMNNQEKLNGVVVAINAGLFLSNAIIFKSMLDERR